MVHVCVVDRLGTRPRSTTTTSDISYRSRAEAIVLLVSGVYFFFLANAALQLKAQGLVAANVLTWR